MPEMESEDAMHSVSKLNARRKLKTTDSVTFRLCGSAKHEA